MAWAFVQANGTAEAGSDGNVAHTYSSNPTAGNLLVIGVSWSPTATSISSVSGGGTWTQVATGSPLDISSGTFGFAMYWAIADGGATTVTVSWGSAVTEKLLVCGEWSGIASSPFDVSVGQAQPNPGTGTDAVTSGTSASATSQANDLIVAAFVNRAPGNTPSAGTNFTLRGSAVGGSFHEMQFEDRNLASAAQFAGTFTVSVGSDCGTIAAAFKEPAAGGGGHRPRARLLMGVG